MLRYDTRRGYGRDGHAHGGPLSVAGGLRAVTACGPGDLMTEMERLGQSEVTSMHLYHHGQVG